jgi:type I restriction enzyme S subunit
VSVSKVVDSVFEYRPIGYGASVFSGFAFKSSDLKGEGIPVIKIGNIQNRVVDYSNTQFFPEEKVTSRHEKYFLSDGDVLIAMTGQGSVGRVGKIRILDSKKILLNQRVGKFAVDNINLDNNYLYYIISSPLYESILFNAGIGSGQPNLSPQDILSVEIPYPDIKEQKAIAATLSVLDDMIELNNQINKTLEEMAQAIFKSWFVDFEPFKDGEFEESELGLIPKGWRVVELGEITEEIRERVKDRKIPVFSAVKTGDLVLSEDYFTKQVFSRDISKYIVVKPFDFAYNPARINIGSIGINEFSYTGCVSPVYVVFRTDQKYKWFFKMLTRTERFKKEVNTRASGSVRQTLNFDEFSKIKVVYPYAEIVEEYNYIFEGLIMAKSKIEEEISILSEIRDTLLPKLMSGEIRVPVEEVI